MLPRWSLWKILAALCACALVALGLMTATPGFARQEAGQNKAAASSFPKDIDPESGFRLPDPKREDMDPDAQKLYDQIVGNNKAALWSPFGIQFYSPKFQVLQRQMNQFLRSPEAGIPPDIQEVAILVASREANGEYEWTAHEPAALKAGADQATIDVVKYRKPLTGVPEKYAAVIQLGREMFIDKKVSSDTFARANKLLGPRVLVNTVGLMGFYYANAGMLTVFDLQMPPGRKPLLPLP